MTNKKLKITTDLQATNENKARMLANQLTGNMLPGFKEGFYQGALIALNTENKKISIKLDKNTNTKSFIEQAINIHGDKYDYSLVNYIGPLNKVIIICKEHGQFEQRPSNHLNDYECPKCHIMFMKAINS